jgi:hypothetical protein
MATTKHRLGELTSPARELRDPAVEESADVWAPAAAAPRPTARLRGPAPVVAREPLRARLRAPITGGWAAIGTVAWVVLLPVGIAVEPPPDNPNAVGPWYAGALGAILVVALLSALAGFWLRRRWSLAASLVASGVLVLSTVICPVSGHHTDVGAWWVVQLGCGLGLVTISSLGLQRG